MVGTLRAESHWSFSVVLVASVCILWAHFCSDPNTNGHCVDPNIYSLQHRINVGDRWCELFILSENCTHCHRFKQTECTKCMSWGEAVTSEHLLFHEWLPSVASEHFLLYEWLTSVTCTRLRSRLVLLLFLFPAGRWRHGRTSG